MDSKTDEEVFTFFANWYSRNIDASDRLHPNDWKVIPYKDAYIVRPSGTGRTSYMHIIRDNHCIGFHLGVRDGDCIGFSLALLSLEKAYQKLLERENPKERQTQDPTPPQQSPIE